jgi:hypothetical protein
MNDLSKIQCTQIDYDDHLTTMHFLHCIFERSFILMYFEEIVI